MSQNYAQRGVPSLDEMDALLARVRTMKAARLNARRAENAYEEAEAAYQDACNMRVRLEKLRQFHEDLDDEERRRTQARARQSHSYYNTGSRYGAYPEYEPQSKPHSESRSTSEQPRFSRRAESNPSHAKSPRDTRSSHTTQAREAESSDPWQSAKTYKRTVHEEWTFYEAESPKDSEKAQSNKPPNPTPPKTGPPPSPHKSKPPPAKSTPPPEPDPIIADWKSYITRWKRLQALIRDPRATVSLSDVPWPISSSAKKITLEGIRTFLLSPLHSPDMSTKKRIHASLLLYHPDKLNGFADKIVDLLDRDWVMQQAGYVVRCLNALLEEQA